MGECIITRSGAGETDTIVPITPGYHTILVTLKTDKGSIMKEYPLSCKDGLSWYNYSTNEKGQCIFTCNSGSANIFISNEYNGIRYIDFDNTWFNISAPIGLTSKVNANLNYSNNGGFIEFVNNTLFSVIEDRESKNVIIIGGGGGGQYSLSGVGVERNIGWGGGAGYFNEYNQVQFIKNNTYNFIVGNGGNRGSLSKISGSVVKTNASSGGTSYIVGTDMFAVGGSGGATGRGGIGGLGSCTSANNGTDSSLNYAGGGGAKGGLSCININDYIGGKPYGGNGGISESYHQSQKILRPPSDGKRGGGGGGGAGCNYGDDYIYRNGANGGSGLLRIYL